MEKLLLLDYCLWYRKNPDADIHIYNYDERIKWEILLLYRLLAKDLIL